MKLLLSFLSLAAVSVFAAPVPASFSLTPASAPLVGFNFTVNLYILGVTDLSGWQSDIDYTPATLSVVSVSEGNFLGTGGSTFFIPGTNDVTTGVIANNADTLISSSGVDGSGLLLDIVFHGIKPGPAVVATDNVTLLDSNLNNISYIPGVLSFTVSPNLGGGGPGGAPEPATSALITVAGALMILFGRARRRRSR